jgi:hypothetical protein
MREVFMAVISESEESRENAVIDATSADIGMVMTRTRQNKGQQFERGRDRDSFGDHQFRQSEHLLDEQHERDDEHAEEEGRKELFEYIAVQDLDLEHGYLLISSSMRCSIRFIPK